MMRVVTLCLLLGAPEGPLLVCKESDAAFCARLGGSGRTPGTDACGAGRTVDCGPCRLPSATHPPSNSLCDEDDETFCARLGKNCGEVSGLDACGKPRTARCGPGGTVRAGTCAEQIAIVPDPCIDDSGKNAANDNLEIYCHEGVMRFCLSGEACPWRAGPAPRTKSTCSAAGLERTAMATLRGKAGECALPMGARVVCCYPDDKARQLGTALLSAGDCP
jgi:hypothetical protein